jgi:hypothetical protein
MRPPAVIVAELDRPDQDRMRSLSPVKLLHCESRRTTAPIPFRHLKIQKPALAAHRFTQSARCPYLRTGIQYP